MNNIDFSKFMNGNKKKAMVFLAGMTAGMAVLTAISCMKERCFKDTCCVIDEM